MLSLVQEVRSLCLDIIVDFKWSSVLIKINEYSLGHSQNISADLNIVTMHWVLSSVVRILKIGKSQNRQRLLSLRLLVDSWTLGEKESN